MNDALLLWGADFGASESKEFTVYFVTDVLTVASF